MSENKSKTTNSPRAAGSTVMVALGGNALIGPDERGTYEQQRANVRETAGILVDLIESDTNLVLTHGNGPQVGSILIQNDSAADLTPPMPLFACGAQTQGLIGNMLQTALVSEFSTRGIDRSCVPLVTPVTVEPDDPAFDNPTKPIGPTYPSPDAVPQDDDVHVAEVADGEWRQVVPSPEPQEIHGTELVSTTLDQGDVPVVAGGGGVPVIESDSGELRGVNAVIDKDLTGARLAQQLGADVFLILTDVARVALNYGQPDETPLDGMTVETARGYMERGHFGRGSMYEKVEAACRFAEGHADRRAIITRLDLAEEALAGDAGTTIEQDWR